MKIVKIMWALRALIYKPFLKKMGRLTYIGKPIWMSKKKNIEFGNKVRIYPGSRLRQLKMERFEYMTMYQ